jgi:hypothetical protein
VIAQPRQPEFDTAFDGLAVSDAPANLQRFARKETLRDEPGRERRQDRRYSLITNVTVTPVDKALRPLGPSFVALSSGMSVSGIRLLYTQPAPSKFLRLEFEGQQVAFLLTVLRSRPIGDCFEIAGRLTKTDVGNQNANELTLTTTGNDAVSATEQSFGNDHLDPTTGPEVDHWQGVIAATQLLDARRKGQS